MSKNFECLVCPTKTLELYKLKKNENRLKKIKIQKYFKRKIKLIEILFDFQNFVIFFS